jgi:hypothetical protein
MKWSRPTHVLKHGMHREGHEGDRFQVWTKSLEKTA